MFGLREGSRKNRWTIAPRDIRCRMANRITRIVFRMVSGRQLFQHPSRLDRKYVMEKLLTYQQILKMVPGIKKTGSLPVRARSDESSNDVQNVTADLRSNPHNARGYS